MKLSLNDYFLLTHTGEYRVSLLIKHSLFQEKTFVTETVIFTVNTGNIELTKKFGFYDKIRKKILSKEYQIISYKKDYYTYLYLRVQDDDWIYGQVFLGRKIYGVKFTSHIDSLANMHIFTQFESRKFYHIIVSPKGKLKQNVTYKATKQSIPQLIKDYESGKVSVIGGVKQSSFLN